MSYLMINIKKKQSLMKLNRIESNKYLLNSNI